MKKLFATTLVLASTAAFAGTSATLGLKGTIAPLLDISVAAEPLATSLPLDQAVNSQKVGVVTAKSNSGVGFKISVASQNSGKLVRSGDANSFVQYQLSYNGSNVALNPSPAQIESNLQRGVFDRDLRISYAKPADYMAAGDYTDVVTFTISAN